jgi:hypothetical protein
MDVISKHMVGELQNGKGRVGASTGDNTSFIDGRLFGPDDRIYDLVDVVEDGSIPADKNEQEIIVIDGRVYQRLMQPTDRVFELTDVIEEGCSGEVNRVVSEIAERVAREIIPGIAERLIREEIEKLKG